MKKLIITTIIVTTAAISIPALAGRDGTEIMLQERASKAVAEQRAREAEKPGMASTKLGLPLDHGPRAQTTPWLNQQRQRKADAAAAASGATTNAGSSK